MPIGTRRGGVGFTLIELLVVIALISLLASILVMAVRGQVTAARRAATMTTLTKINVELDNRSKGLRTYWDNLGTQQERYIVTYGYFEAAGRDKELAKVLAWKDLCRINFPQRFSEIKDSTGTALTDNGTAESAEVLYYLITGEEIPNSGTPPVRIQIPGYAAVGSDAFSTVDTADTDGDLRREFVDSWGYPLRFYRWPTKLIQRIVTSNEPECRALIRGLPSDKDLVRDPDDPLSLTTKEAWSGSSTCEANWHTPSVYHVKLVVSMGEDAVLGLYEPNDTGNYGHLCAVQNVGYLTDDMTNLNITVGGK